MNQATRKKLIRVTLIAGVTLLVAGGVLFGVPLLYVGPLHFHWYKLKKSDFTELEGEVGTLIATHQDEIRGTREFRLPQDQWSKAIARHKPQIVYLNDSHIFLWWGDHFGEHGVRVFTSATTSNIAYHASRFVRTFECTRIDDRVWFYTGD